MITNRNLTAHVDRRQEKQQHDNNSLLHLCIKKVYKNIDKHTPANGVISLEDQREIVRQILCLPNRNGDDSDCELLNTNTNKYMPERVTKGTTLLLVAMFLRVNRALSEISATKFWNLRADNALSKVSTAQFWSWLESLNSGINFTSCKSSMNRYINATQVQTWGQQPDIFTLEGRSKHEWFKCFKTQPYNISFAQDIYLKNMLDQHNPGDFFNASPYYSSDISLQQQAYIMACSVGNSTINNQYKIAAMLINDKLHLNQESVKQFAISMGFSHEMANTWHESENFGELLLNHIESLSNKDLPNESFLLCCLIHLFDKVKNNNPENSYVQNLILNYLFVNDMEDHPLIENHVIALVDIALNNHPQTRMNLFDKMLLNKPSAKFTEYLFKHICKKESYANLLQCENRINEIIGVLAEDEANTKDCLQKMQKKILEVTKYKSSLKYKYSLPYSSLLTSKVWKYFVPEKVQPTHQQEAKNAIVSLTGLMKKAVGTAIEKSVVPARVYALPNSLKKRYINRVTSKILSIILAVDDPRKLSRITYLTNNASKLLSKIISNSDIGAKDVVDLFDNFLYFYMLDHTEYLEQDISPNQANNVVEEIRKLAKDALSNFVDIEDKLISNFLLPIINTMVASDKDANLAWEYIKFKLPILTSTVKNYFFPAIFPSKLLTVIENINDTEILSQIKSKANYIYDLYQQLGTDYRDIIEDFLFNLVFLMSDITDVVDLNTFMPDVNDLKGDLSEFRIQTLRSVDGLRGTLQHFQDSATARKLVPVGENLPIFLQKIVVNGVSDVIIKSLLNSISRPIELCQDIRLLSRIQHNIDKINKKCLRLRMWGVGIADIYGLFESIQVLMTVKSVNVSDINVSTVKKYKKLATEAVQSIEKIENELLSYNPWHPLDIKTQAANVIKYYVFPAQHLLTVINETNDVATLKKIMIQADKLNKLYDHKFEEYGIYFKETITHIAMLVYDLTTIQKIKLT